MRFDNLLFCGLLVTSWAYAHEEVSGLYPAEKNAARTTLIAGLGLKALAGERAYPAPRFPGILESGSARADERNSGIDYVELGIKVKLAENVAIKIKGARHGGSSPTSEMEEVWLSAQQEAGERRWHEQLGRQQMPLGLQNRQHFHAWTFGIAPLALRAAINDSWRADGLQINRDGVSGWGFGAGLWENSAFPGAPSSSVNLAHLRLGWRNEAAQIEAAYAHAEVAAGRPLVTLGSAGHTHTLPSCGIVTATRVCFNGHAGVATLAGKWAGGATWWLGGEWWRKRDAGKLDSIFGTPDYQGILNGGWLDLGWMPHPEWEVILRAERVVGTHRLTGNNASLIATQAGIADSDRALVSRGLALRWQPAEAHRFTLEHHRENVEVQPNSVTLLRYQYSYAH